MEDITTIPSVAADEAITTNYDNGSEDLIRFRYCSVLAQIEIASCFRNDIEPLFVLFNRLASIPRKPYEVGIPDLLMVISFGRVVWMVEKSGVEMAESLPGSIAIRNRAKIRCARNIARWWMVELHERVKKDTTVSYPGEIAMSRGLMPVALWLATREYGGIWRHGGGEGNFEEKEFLGRMGDVRLPSIFEALSVYGLNSAAGNTLRPPWYRDKFVEWAEEIASLAVLPDMKRHSAVVRRDWCGLKGCPYPYVTEMIIAPSKGVGRTLYKEGAFPVHVYDRMMYPRWGVTRRDEKEGQAEVIEEVSEDEDLHDYSPVSEE